MNLARNIMADVREIKKCCSKLGLGLGHHPIWSNEQVLDLADEIDRLSQKPLFGAVKVTAEEFQQLRKFSIVQLGNATQYQVLVMTRNIDPKVMEDFYENVVGDYDIILAYMEK